MRSSWQWGSNTRQVSFCRHRAGNASSAPMQQSSALRFVDCRRPRQKLAFQCGKRPQDFVAHAPAIPSGVKERMSNRVAPGTLLAEKYRLVSLLGRGGMGEVWQAEHLGLRAPVAIKLMNPEVVSNPEALARFNREARAAMKLKVLEALE